MTYPNWNMVVVIMDILIHNGNEISKVGFIPASGGGWVPYVLGTYIQRYAIVTNSNWNLIIVVDILIHDMTT